MRVTATFLALLFAAAIAQQTNATATVNVAANSNTAIPVTFDYTVSAQGDVLVATLNTLVGASVSLTTTSFKAFTMVITATLDPSFAASSTATLNTAGLAVTGFGSLNTPLYLSFSGAQSATAKSTMTLTVTPLASLGVSANGDTQLHLFASTPATDGNVTNNYYGAVAVSSQSPGTLSYTINLPVAPDQRFVFGTATKANFAAGSNNASDSSAFSSSNGYIPVALNNTFNYANGVQYRAGNNLYIAAQSNISLTVNSANNFTGRNNAPSTTYGTIGYSYQITTTTNNNNNGGSSSSNTNGNGYVALRWVGQISSLIGSSVAANATTAQNSTWYKSTFTSATVASWKQQTSNTTVDANSQVIVVTRTNSFSQWTVAADGQSGDASAVRVGILVLVMAALSILL